MFSYLFFLLIVVISASQDNHQSQVDVIFDTADVASTYALPNGETVSLQAFRTKRTNQLLSKLPNSLTTHEVHTLRWVTPGFCHLVPNSMRLGSMYAQAKVSCIDNDIQQFIANLASHQYGLNITERQVLRLTLSRFVCKLPILTSSDKKLTIRGEVKSFQVHPLTLVFDAALNSLEGEALKRAVANNESLNVDCETYANGRVEKKNSLRIDFGNIGQSEFVERLIGDGQEAYVTRNQMNAFSDDLYRSLNIEEEYEMPLTAFSENFVSEFIRFAQTAGFRDVPIKDALEILSRYAIDTSLDLSPDTVIRDLSSLYLLQHINNETHIILNQSHLDQLLQKHSSSSSSSDSANVGIKFLSFGGSSSGSSSHNSDYRSNYDNKSLSDNLFKLNSKIANQVTFEIEGNRVIPKMLKVAKLIKSNLKHAFHLSRVQKQQYVAPYSERAHMAYNEGSFSEMSPQVSSVVDKHLRDLREQLHREIQVVMTSAKNHDDKLAQQIVNAKVQSDALIQQIEQRNDALIQQIGQRIDSLTNTVASNRPSYFACYMVLLEKIQSNHNERSFDLSACIGSHKPYSVVLTIVQRTYNWNNGHNNMNFRALQTNEPAQSSVTRSFADYYYSPENSYTVIIPWNPAGSKSVSISVTSNSDGSHPGTGISGSANWHNIVLTGIFSTD